MGGWTGIAGLDKAWDLVGCPSCMFHAGPVVSFCHSRFPVADTDTHTERFSRDEDCVIECGAIMLSIVPEECFLTKIG